MVRSIGDVLPYGAISWSAPSLVMPNTCDIRVHSVILPICFCCLVAQGHMLSELPSHLYKTTSPPPPSSPLLFLFTPQQTTRGTISFQPRN